MFGNNVMKIKVGGMMCEHCVKRVSEILFALDGVKGVDIDLKSGVVTIKHKGELNLSLVEKAINDVDYRFEGAIQ